MNGCAFVLTSVLQGVQSICSPLVPNPSCVQAALSTHHIIETCRFRLPPPPIHRALRPIRAARKLRGVRVVVRAIAKAIPAVGDVLLVGTLFYFIFGVLAVNLLQGQLFSCVDKSNQKVLDPYYLVAADSIDVNWCGGQPHVGYHRLPG